MRGNGVSGKKRRSKDQKFSLLIRGTSQSADPRGSISLRFEVGYASVDSRVGDLE